ncbi:MAG TPA: type III secretion system chaperone, partial [Opitutales bacterium]|nr:type III secretion system chaperone [Opitutales bacterium]
MSFRAILDHLSYDMGVPLVLDQQGKCKIFYQKRLEVFFGSNQSEDRFHIYGTVCALPEGTDRESLYASLLKAHAFGYASGGALFGISKEAQEILLF